MSLSTTEVRALSLLLQRCLALPPEEREAWIAALPQPQQLLVPRLRQRLDELAPPLALPAGGSAEPALPVLPAARLDPRHGELVGPYRLLHPLHEGPGGDRAGRPGDGVGDDPGGPAADDLAECWLVERADAAVRGAAAPREPLVLMFLPGSAAQRMVAALPEHDHVVRLLDAGIDVQGRAWRVMRHVAGVGLAAHASRRGLDVLQRVALLQPVVDAVMAAHAERIAHAHLGEASVRVDDEGRALLLDWGRGRLLNASTAAADIAGLGALLHALLARNVAARKVGPDLREVLARTAADAPPGRRYATLPELAADLQRVVERQPVSGAVAPPGHRALMALRRHPAGWAAGATTVVLLAVAVVVGLRSHTAGRAQAQRIAQAGEFLAATLESADAPAPQQARRVQQALEAARTGFAGDPLLRGRVLAGLALRFRALDQPEQSLNVLREAHALLERTAGNDPALPAVRAELAWDLLHSGRPDAAAQALDLARRALAGCGSGAECAAVRDRAQAVLQQSGRDGAAARPATTPSSRP